MLTSRSNGGTVAEPLDDPLKGYRDLAAPARYRGGLGNAAADTKRHAGPRNADRAPWPRTLSGAVGSADPGGPDAWSGWRALCGSAPGDVKRPARPFRWEHRRLGRVRRILLLIAAIGVAGAACGDGTVAATPPITPGTVAAPREVNVIARDYSFVPATVDLVPGETVLLHVVNGGLEVHEAVIGDARVQDAWEAAEAATAGAPPGPTPLVSVPPDVAGIRLVVRSGERMDLVWTVPANAPSGGAWVVGCHIPGHWERGMQVPVRWVPSETTAP